MTVRMTLCTLWVLTVFLTPFGVLGISTIGSSGMLGVIETDADTDPNERVSVVVKVAGGISASDLCAELDSTCVTLHERRQKGVLLLLERAEQTQVAVLEDLRRLESEGLAANIEIKWLTNGIAVDMAPSEVSRITRHPDVIDTYERPVLQPMEPVFRKDAPSRSQGSTGGAEDNLRFIGADSAWKMGYTGKGRVVCHLDLEGIDGSHPALYDSWKGHDGDSAAAYHGRPVDGAFPVAVYGDHGTLVTGIIVGHDDLTGDTIGVAPDAEWIGSLGSSLEWAANPDGDPLTTDDVPDVINISFYTYYRCSEYYWRNIDIVEALGIVVVIAAGNKGAGGSMTVTSPGSRALDSLTDFAVGSCHHVDGIVSAFSGRGPSFCDSISVKPNVMAPGGWIRTSTLNGEYKYTGGTSLSAPHVAGAVAILRQYSPNATVREIKEALLAGCTPAGSPVPNNDYGWGIINIPASMEYLTPDLTADLRVKSFTYEPTDVDDTLIARLSIKNRGCPSDSIRAVFADSYLGFRIAEDSIRFGYLDLEDTSSALLHIVFDDSLFPGPTLTAPFELRSSDGYVSPCTLKVLAGIPGEREFFTHKNDMLKFTISNFGKFGSTYHDGLGFRWSNNPFNDLYEAALMIAVSDDQVSDGFRNENGEPDDDFWVNGTDRLLVASPGAAADLETSCVFDDGLAENRIGIQVCQRTFTWNTTPDDRYVVLEYAVKNVTDRTVENLFVGLCFDWAIGFRNNPDYLGEGAFSEIEELGYMYRLGHKPYSEELNGDTGSYRGLSVLNAEGTHSFRTLNLSHVTYPESLKFAHMSGGIVDSVVSSQVNHTLLHVLSTGPFSLAPGECDTAAFAIIGADSLSEMKATAVRAREKWRGIAAKYAQPERFWLDSNYPNPFNARTTISYTLLDPAHVTLEVYNILGQRVETVMDGFMASGRHTSSWNATGYSTGVYFVSMTVGETSQSLKMLLIK